MLNEVKIFCRKTHEKSEGRWRLVIQFSGGPMDDKRALVDIEHHKINFANFLKYKLKCGYSARDFMYYMKRYDNNTAMLHRIDYEEDALTMIEREDN